MNLNLAIINHSRIRTLEMHRQLLPRISGFLMTEPICLRACCPAFCTFTWESVSTSVSLGTMLGKQEESCLGAQYAIAPSNSTDPVNEVHQGKKDKRKDKTQY